MRTLSVTRWSTSGFLEYMNKFMLHGYITASCERRMLPIYLASIKEYNTAIKLPQGKIIVYVQEMIFILIYHAAPDTRSSMCHF